MKNLDELKNLSKLKNIDNTDIIIDIEGNENNIIDSGFNHTNKSKGFSTDELFQDELIYNNSEDFN